MAKVAVRPASQEVYNEVLATAFDGRGRNARYRQHQLFFLHSHLRTDHEKIRKAIKEDTSSTEASVDVEFGLALNAIRSLYAEINFEQSVKDEFMIARNSDNTRRRIPYGVIVLRPTTHTRFFSIVSTIATAFAAGNVVLLEVRLFLMQKFNVAATRNSQADKKIS